MTLGVFTVRRVPRNFCAMHQKLGIWCEDGTDRWHCDDCLGDATWYAERKLRVDREIHAANHGLMHYVPSCPFCNPRAAA